MNVTEPTSNEVWIAYQTYLPRWAFDWTMDKLVAAKKNQADAEAYRAWCANLSTTRTDNLEAVIAEYYQRHQLALEAVPTCHRANMLLDRLKRAFYHGEISHVPSLKLIRRVIKKLAPQNT